MSEQNACPKCGTNFWMNVAPNGAALYRCGYVVGGLQTDGCRIRELEKEVDKLRRLAPLCPNHGNGAGARSSCPYCALSELQEALSDIDLIISGDNDYHMSLYDADLDHKRVVAAVKSLKEAAK